MTTHRPACDINGCEVPAIGLGRCVQHIAALIAAAGKENAPAVAGPGRSETPTYADGVYERR